MKLTLESLYAQRTVIEIKESDTVGDLLHHLDNKTTNLKPFLLVDGNIISPDVSISNLPNYDSYLILHQNIESTSPILEDTENEILTNTYETLLEELPNSNGNPIIQEIQNLLANYSNPNATLDINSNSNVSDLTNSDSNSNNLYSNLLQQIHQIGNILDNSNVPLPLPLVQPISNFNNYAPLNNNILSDTQLAPINQPVANFLENSPLFPGNNTISSSQSDENTLLSDEEISLSDDELSVDEETLSEETIEQIPVNNITENILPPVNLPIHNLFNNFQNIPVLPTNMGSHSINDLEQLRTTYISQLESMQLMGFQQDETNLQALIINNGNLENSINWILNLN